MRRTARYKVEGPNSLWQLYKTVPFWKVVKNFMVIQIGRYTPSVKLKRWLYRTFLKMDIGESAALAVMVMPDIMYPEYITIGANTVIGYNTTLLAHEYLIDEYRLGKIHIGNRVMVGANSTILPGIIIGDGAVVSAGTLVHKDVPEGAFVGGNPMQLIYTKEEQRERKNRD
ncbi:acetyltransferase-like isoleucine patch superfamily enzyme [Scopulibacillus darangshiensis]|uniref:Acetyltransferase-like isoleucine patch superfamily enzyme n=1 Tax=Scopulibacillus darangshiensis TaxID=442528 RepID=A0A4R2NTR6_9BACL|nr:acyltransferase [Scopulibacillus darangshiensis]TCP24884.1 acetyltransferase-like isoleucine patch superfamily enzyme [Scopulibacillus darangshiensis]